ncbi:g10644 [Coccomyxa elongata]
MTDKAGPRGTVEVGDAQLVSNSLGPFLTLASTTSLAHPVGASGAGAAEEAAAAAAAADAAATADAEEAAGPPAGPPNGQAPGSPVGQPAAGPPPESPPEQHVHTSTPTPAGMC